MPEVEELQGEVVVAGAVTPATRQQGTVVVKQAAAVATRSFLVDVHLLDPRK